VYPNSGAVYSAETKTWTNTSEPSSWDALVKEWIDLGADIIGGCCGVNTEQIKAMSKIIKQQ
jgi:homocysteine S-methyltransferase